MEEIKRYFKNKQNRSRFFLYFFLIIALCFSFFRNDITAEKEVSLTSFIHELSKEKSDKLPLKIEVYDKTHSFHYVLDGEKYKVKYPERFLVENDLFIQQLSEKEIEIEMKTSRLLAFTSLIQPLISILFLVFLFYMIRPMLESSLGSVEEVKDELVTFDDVAGYQTVKEEMKEIVEFLKNPSAYARFTTKLPKGILLEGPPGNGKTWLAKAVAGETKTPFFQISASDVEDMFVGSGARKLQKIFKTIKATAKKKGKAILFVDEIDAIGMRRDKRTVVETNQTINKLLTELDGFDKETNILVIAATNLASVLDPALTRSGRFDRVITVNLPSFEDRKAILSLYLNKRSDVIDETVKVEEFLATLARQTAGFCNADLDTLINEACLRANRDKKELVDIESIQSAYTKIIAGLKQDTPLTDEERTIVAYHEAGHAVSALLLFEEGIKQISYITIAPYGQSLGHVAKFSENERLIRKSVLRKDIQVLFAGRAVEDILLKGDVTTGASNDLYRADDMIRQYISKFGMSESLKNYYDSPEDTPKNVRLEIDSLRDELYNETFMLVQDNWSLVALVAEKLIEQETIQQYELSTILANYSSNKSLE